MNRRVAQKNPRRDVYLHSAGEQIIWLPWYLYSPFPSDKSHILFNMCKSSKRARASFKKNQQFL